MEKEALAVVGSAVGPYQIIARLGAGGMGEVFLGHDSRLHRRVALKCLTADAGNEEMRGRVMREARAIARLNHPNIAGIHDVLESDGRTYIVMEYVEGESLAAGLARGRLSLDAVLAIGRQLTAALDAAHANGVVHRDLKPANIHITPEGSIKVLDFGIAKLSSPITASPDDSTGGGVVEVTLAGNPGTPIYMSPEQLFDHPIDARSDIYSAAVVLYLLATGRRPYAETGTVALAVAMSEGPPPAARDLNPAVPPQLSAALARALALDPANRFQSAREFGAALVGSDDATIGLASGARILAARRVRAWWRRWWTPLVAAAMLLTLGLTARKPLMFRLGFDPSRAVVSQPAVLAVLPVANPSGDPRADRIGAALAAIVAENFGSTPGLSVISRAITAPFDNRRDDLEVLRRELGAGYVLDLRFKSPPPAAEVDVRLRRTRDRIALWEQTLRGDALVIEQVLLEQVGRALERAGVWGRRLSDADWARIRRVPTASGPALDAYSEARVLIDTPGAPENLTRAVALLERAISLDPRFALAHAALGDAYLEQYRAGRDPDLATKANDAVMRALREDPDAAPIYYSLGNVQWATGRYQDAVSSLKRSIELQPDSDDAHRLLGRVLADRGDVDGAVVEVKRAIELRPGYWRNYMFLGAIAYTAGRYADSLAAYRQAGDLQPNDPGPFTGMGFIYQVTGDLSQAIGNYEHAVRLGPSPGAYSQLGLAYYLAKEYRRAIDAWKQALAVNPKSALYHRNIGDAYQRLRDPASAAASYREAVRLGEEFLKVNPRDTDTIALVAVCEAKLGRTAAADRHAAEAVTLAPASRIAWQRSAEVHALIGKTDAALKELAEAIARGYSRSIARDNDEFESIKRLPAFQALVAESPAGGSKER